MCMIEIGRGEAKGPGRLAPAAGYGRSWRLDARAGAGGGPPRHPRARACGLGMCAPRRSGPRGLQQGED
jgi:hypothetical protein